jgi:hypothetical protein
MTPETLFTTALTHVESASIRKWAESERNRPIWLELATAALKKNPSSDPIRFATFIVLKAMG